MQESMEKGRRASLTALVPSIIFITLILFFIVKTFFSPVWAIVLDTEGNYFMAGKIFICGNTIMYSKSSFSDKSKENVLDDKTGSFHLTVSTMDKIKHIEIIPEEDKSAEPAEKAWPPEYFGKYKLNVQGHDGTLVLWSKDGKIHGTMKFRTWGTGATEYLKGIRISGKNIYFTRSASTSAEAARLGANNIFRQNFSGTYSSSGKKISGFFVNDRKEKYEWKAER